MKRLARCLAALIIFAAAGLTAFAAESQKTGPQKSTVMVRMHDGVGLATDIYRPAGQKGPLPVILMRTPYGKGGAQSFGQSAVKHGYVLLSQDMRGRFNSEGNDSVVFHNDGWGTRRDGQETLEWIAKQPWCNGSIATYGGSALGITQTMMAPGAAATLKRNTCRSPSTTCIRRARIKGACGGNR